MAKITKLLDIVGRLSDFDEDGTIYAAEPWTEDSAATLNAMAPKLQAIYGGNGRWEDAIAKALHMPDTMPDAIRDMWRKNLKIAHDNKVTLTPQQFAEMFVDNNFAG